MSEPILPKEVLQRQQEQEMEDAATLQASAKALPGPAAEAFLRGQPDEVEGFKIREFYDGDFEIMQELEHPLTGLLAKILAGEDPKDSSEEIMRKTVRGRNAWNLCYILTTEIEKVAEIYEKGGIKQLQIEASKKFGIGSKVKTGILTQIASVAFTKISLASATMVSHGAPKQENKEGASGPENPPQSGPQLTVQDGC